MTLERKGLLASVGWPVDVKGTRRQHKRERNESSAERGSVHLCLHPSETGRTTLET